MDISSLINKVKGAKKSKEEKNLEERLLCFLFSLS